MTSASSLKRITGASGPKVSSCATSESGLTSESTVGSKNERPSSLRLPPVTTLAPRLTASAMWRSTLSTAFKLISGPCVTPVSVPSPIFIAATFFDSFRSDLGAALDGIGDVALDLVDRFQIDQRALRDAGFRAVADLHRGDLLRQLQIGPWRRA